MILAGGQAGRFTTTRFGESRDATWMSGAITAPGAMAAVSVPAILIS